MSCSWGSSMRRRGRRRRIYISTSPRKLYFPEEKYRDTSFVNSRVGFDVVFTEYIQKLHFFGFASLSALARSRAAVFRSPSSKHCAKLLADACFLLHVSKDFSRVGIPTTGIRIGEELSGESTRGYIDYVRNSDIPPPLLLLQSVPTIGCDGNSKALTKCGKNVTPPKRTGAPMLRRGGAKLPPKPFRNGCFFVGHRTGGDSLGYSNGRARK